MLAAAVGFLTILPVEPAEAGGLLGQLGGSSGVAVRRCFCRGSRRASSTAERAALAPASSAAATAAGVMRAGRSRKDGVLLPLLIRDRVYGGVVPLPGTVGPQLIGMGGQGDEGGVPIFSQDDPDLRWQPLEKQAPENSGLGLALRAELDHIMQHVGQLLAAEGLRGE